VDINEAAHTGAAEHGADDIAVARRRLLVAGASGAALSLLPFLVGRAAASNTNEAAPTSSGTGNTGAPNGDATGTGDSTNSTPANSTTGSGGSTPDTEAATTTIAPPKRPSNADIKLLSFAQMIELTARDLYKAGLDKGVFADETLETVKAIGEAHEAYAQAISGLIGRLAPNAPDAALFDELSKGFGTGDVATAARNLENNLVATHVDIIGQLEGVDGSALMASVVVVEARHATVLAHIAGVIDLDDELATDGVAIAASEPAK
jgi:Ferritin-like domain